MALREGFPLILATLANGFESLLDSKAESYDASMIDIQDAGAMLDESRGAEAEGSESNAVFSSGRLTWKELLGAQIRRRIGVVLSRLGSFIKASYKADWPPTNLSSFACDIRGTSYMIHCIAPTPLNIPAVFLITHWMPFARALKSTSSRAPFEITSAKSLFTILRTSGRFRTTVCFRSIMFPVLISWRSRTSLRSFPKA